MTIHGKQWGMLARLLYKWLRPQLEKTVKDSKNTLDNTALDVMDTLANYKK